MGHSARTVCADSRLSRLWPFWLKAVCPCTSALFLTQAHVPVHLSPPPHPWGDLHGRPAHLSVRACHLSQCFGDGCIGFRSLCSRIISQRFYSETFLNPPKAWGFSSRKSPQVPGAHKNGAAISSPRIADIYWKRPKGTLPKGTGGKVKF